MIIVLASQFHIYLLCLWACLVYCLNGLLNVGAFSVIAALIIMLGAEAAATLTTELSQCSGHFTLDWAKFVVASKT